MSDTSPPPGPSERAGKSKAKSKKSPPETTNWTRRIDELVSGILIVPPPGLDSDLANAFSAVATGIRECTRIKLSSEHLRGDEGGYRLHAKWLADAAVAAKNAYRVVDIRLRQAGGPNPMLDTLNDILTVQGRTPLDPTRTPGGLNSILTKLNTTGAELFPRVEGRGCIDRMLTQLAKVPPIPPKATEQNGQTGSVSESDRRKKGTAKGDAKSKLVAALTQHHKYSEGACLNMEAVGNNELARLARVGTGTASEFFKTHFKGLNKYRACCRDSSKLIASLKLLNGEFTPAILMRNGPAIDNLESK